MTKEDLISPTIDTQQHEQVITLVTAKSHYESKDGAILDDSGMQTQHSKTPIPSATYQTQWLHFDWIVTV